MIRLKSRVGQWNLNWKTIPRGREGVAQVEVEPGKVLEVRWCRDSDGIWLQLPHGLFGFDLKSENDEMGQRIYQVSERGGHLEWGGISSSIGDEASQTGAKSNRPKAVRVRAQMPGKIIRILAQPDQVVQKDQPIVVMEAMKMENEIRAPQMGKITQVKVTEGQVVETGADLLLIDGNAS